MHGSLAGNVLRGGSQKSNVCLSGFSGINTASSCDGPTCFVPELVAGSFKQFDLGSASDPFTADSLQYVSTQPALVVIQHFRHAYGTPTCALTHFAVTLSYIHTDPDSLPSFAEECSFGN